MTVAALATRCESVRDLLHSVGQEHLLHFYDRLDDAQRDRLLRQIEDIDWPEVARLIRTHVLGKPEFELPEDVQPAPWYPHQPPPELRGKYREARALGEELVRAGKVAAFTVAGGQGTRLGWDGPKGTFPATPIRGLTLFESMAEYIQKVQQKYRCVVPWYVMTSPINDADTRDYFKSNNHCGLDPDNVMLFPQAMMPAIGMPAPAPGSGGGGRADMAGKALLDAPDSLALSPNGHGGSLKALYTCGAIADMERRGIEQISYTQVDNPIVKVVDPLFLGLHALDGCEMSSKMLPKAYPKEKLGNFCLVDGRMTVIEYSDLPDELAEQRLENGELRFRAGSIAIHAIRVDFVRSLNEGRLGGDGASRRDNGQGDRCPGEGTGFGLPFHRAEKKVPYVDLETGRRVEPEKANAVKLETFVFDALPMTRRSIIYETDRVEEFAPIKNADADPPEKSVDSPWTSKRIQTERAARWLAANGVAIPRTGDGSVNAVIEISQLTAIEPEDLRGIDLPEAIEPGARVVV